MDRVRMNRKSKVNSIVKEVLRRGWRFLTHFTGETIKVSGDPSGGRGVSSVMSTEGPTDRQKTETQYNYRPRGCGLSQSYFSKFTYGREENKDREQ